MTASTPSQSSPSYEAMFEFMHRPEDADEHSYRLQLLDYVKHLGFLYYLPRDWDKEHKDLVDIPQDDLLDRTALPQDDLLDRTAR